MIDVRMSVARSRVPRRGRAASDKVVTPGPVRVENAETGEERVEQGPQGRGGLVAEVEGEKGAMPAVRGRDGDEPSLPVRLRDVEPLEAPVPDDPAHATAGGGV